MSETLTALLDEIRSVDLRERASYQRRVAAFGAAAVVPMREWLSDAALAAFAVRVLARICAGPGRAEAAEALRYAAKQAGSPVIRADAAAEIERLALRRDEGHPGAARAKFPSDAVEGALPDGRPCITFHVLSQAQGGHFTVPQAVIDRLELPGADARVWMGVHGGDISFEGELGLRSKNEAYYRLGDQETHGLERIAPRERLEVTLAPPKRPNR